MARTAWQQLLSNLKGLRIAEARLASNSFWAWRIWLALTAWQQLLSPEELEDGRGQARVQKFLSQKDLVGANHLATAPLT
jgi:hypothetical protein